MSVAALYCPAGSAKLLLMEPNRHNLRATLETLVPIDENDWQQLEPMTHPQRFPGGSSLLLAGDRCDRIFYLCSGLVREYYTRSDGSERTRAFAGAGSFTASYADYLGRRVSQISIQALEDTRVLTISLSGVEDLRKTSPTFESVSHRLLEQMYIRKERREFQFLTMTAGERYQRLAEDFPDLERSVQQYHIASYLGITPAALSRIRRRSKRH